MVDAPWMAEALPIGNGNEKNIGAYQTSDDVFIQPEHANPTGYRGELDLDQAVLHWRAEWNLSVFTHR